MTPFLPPESFVGWLLDDALDPARCTELVGELERRGFDATGERYPHEYRNNDRLVFDDPVLAAALFDRLRSRLPAELVVDGARWQLAGLNPRFRACRYRDGQAFCIHRDGPYVPADDERSHLTVQLYLDDAPDRRGGRTRFYADPRGDELWAAITPRCGSAIVFDHRAWHDGEAVTAGIKHVLRTDAMYRRVSAAAVAGADMIGRHRGYAWRVIVCRDGRVASAGRDGTVRRWGRDPCTYDLGAGSVTALVEASDGRLWCGTRSGVIAVIDGERVERVADRAGAILGAAAGAAGHVVFTTSRGTLLGFAPARWPIDLHAGWAWSVSAHGDGFATCGEDGRVVVIERDVRELARLERPLRAIASLPTGALVTGDIAGWLHRVGGASWRAHDAPITGLAIAPDGSVVSSSEDGRIKRWRDDRLIASAAAADLVTSVACDARGDVVCAGYDGMIARVAMREPCSESA